MLLFRDIQLKESKKVIEKAESSHKLTLLAFLFLPVSLSTSFFGMNFREFGQGQLSV
jgi:Mg2+ and Co2+ transporter CorA